MPYVTDVGIIGAGPVGLFSVFACGMSGLRTHVIDSLGEVGGQCFALYPEKPIYDIAAYPSITALELVEKLKAQAGAFGPVYHLNQQVSVIQRFNDQDTKFQITTSKGSVIEAKSIIIAAGAGAFGPNRPPLEDIAAYEGESIHYHVREKAIYKGKNVVIAGGGDSAVDWALILKDIAASVKLVHRRAKFRASPDSEAKLQRAFEAGEIELVVPYQLEGVKGANGKLETVNVASLTTDDKKELQADYLLAFFGLSMELGPILNWGLEIEKKCIAVTPSTMQTNHPGIYAVGDIATYPHKLKLIVTGFAEAMQAAHAIRHHLYPDEIVHFEYSTTKGKPGIK
jgi:thioredoxin reductase (NADPH)